MTTDLVTTPDAVRPDTGELVAPPAPDRIAIEDRFRGASMFPVTQAQMELLTEPVALAELDVLPTGEVYLQQVGYRRRLLGAFHPGGWAMVPLDRPAMVGGTLIQPWALYVNGAFIASAYGEADYQKNNPRTSYATAAEALKSNALMRCCKDLGIASECWDRKFTEGFKRDHCEKGSDNKWRLKDRTAKQKPREPGQEG